MWSFDAHQQRVVRLAAAVAGYLHDRPVPADVLGEPFGEARWRALAGEQRHQFATRAEQPVEQPLAGVEQVLADQADLALYQRQDVAALAAARHRQRLPA